MWGSKAPVLTSCPETGAMTPVHTPPAGTSRRRPATHLATAALLALATAAAPVATTPATAATPGAGTRYVALGDSYSAGNGTGDATDSCYRSPHSYPALVASATGWSLDEQACSGATTADVTASQLPAVDPLAGVLSISIGGNDAGFSAGLQACAAPGWVSDCQDTLDRSQAAIRGPIPRRLAALYASIGSLAPDARRYAVLYPHLFQGASGNDCSGMTFFSPQEQARINELTDELDDRTAAVATAQHMQVVDPRAAFTGHAWCDASAWINGPMPSAWDSFHPNRSGNQAYASLLLASVQGTTGRTVRASGGAARSTAARPAPAPTPAQYRALGVELATPVNLARARRAGLDPARVRTLAAGLRSGVARRQQAALAGVHALERQWERRQAHSR